MATVSDASLLQGESRDRISTAGSTIRVLHVINGEHYAGAERVQDHLACQLGGMEVDMAFACVKPGRFLQARANRDVPTYLLPMRGRVDLRPVAGLVRLIRTERFQMVHAHTVRNLLLAWLACLWTGVPLVYHMHSPTARDSTRRWSNRINAWLERICLRGVSAVICVSHSLARHARGLGVPPQRIFVVHNGVPSRAVRPARDAHADVWTLGTVALFRPRKGLEVLLQALSILRAAGLPVRLRAVGDFEDAAYESGIRRQVCDLGLDDAIDWTGFTTNIDAELARIDLMVLPSLFGEGLPMVVLEAMSAGVPVVASDVEGIAEAIVDQHDGLIVPPGDPQDLARAIARVVRGEIDWDSLRTSALARYDADFSALRMAAGVADVYRHVRGESLMGSDDQAR